MSLLLAVGCDDPSSTTVPSSGSVAERPVPVVLDYSPTVSDVGALLYLASHPDVDLRAVTLAGTGEADCGPGVRATRGLLELAGRSDVPVGCGRDEPLVGDRDWPDEWRAAANAIADMDLPEVHVEDEVDAEDLLVRTLSESDRPVTLITLGPLTNVGSVLDAQPELTDRIDRIVVMGGSLRAGGNVDVAPTAEWNLYVDPESVRLTLASGARVLFVALDATNDVPWTTTLAARVATVDTPAARVERDLLSAGPLDGIYLWDELAVMAALDPTLVTVESVTVTIDGDGALVREARGVAVDVAIGADATAATSELLRVLAGGAAPTFDALSGAESAYFDSLAESTATFQHAFARIFDADADAGPDPDVHALADILFTSLTDLEASLRAISPPAHLENGHVALVESLAAANAASDDVTAALDTAEGDTALDRLFTAASDTGLEQLFQQFLAECRAVEVESLARDGRPVCDSLDEG